MGWEAFYGEIKKGTVRNVYLFTGQEEYTKENALKQLEKALLPEGMELLNSATYENAPAQQIIEACETLPLLCEKRLVVVKDYAPLLSGKAKDETNEAERLSNWLQNPPQSCCLVFFVRGDADARKKLTAQLTKMGADVRFDALSESQISKWIARSLKPYGKAMDAAAENRLVFMVGRSLTSLEGELQKLLSYVGDRSAITENDVVKLVTPQTEYTVFQMIDRAMAGDSAGAHRLLKSSLERGESRIGIIAMLTRQMRLLTHISFMKQAGARLPEIEKRLELTRYVASLAEKQANRFAPERAKAGYEACVAADYAVKTGRARDEQALDSLMLLLPSLATRA